MLSKIAATFIAGALALGGIIVTAPAAQAAPTKYKSCSQLNSTHKGGVAKNSKVKNTKTVNGKKASAKSRHTPKVSASLYKVNSKLDRDRDGIACER